jgi:isocitrate dehydrogenase (NAD+)
MSRVHTVTLIPGDGIGPEICEVTRRAIEATGVRIEWDIQQAGEEAMTKFGTPLPDSVIESIKKNKVAIKAPITTPVGKGFRSVNVALRQALDLYACVRPCKSYAGVPAPYHDVDIVIVRENTEDLYAGIEFQKGDKTTLDLIAQVERAQNRKIPSDAGISLKPISVQGSRRIAKYAFDYAQGNGRKKVTAVHKANIMKFSDGLFLEVATQVAAEYPDIQFEDRIVDNLSMQLVMRPHEYDVLVLPNLYGDIISDLCAGLVGGLGVAPGANIGTQGALFEATHGSAPRYKGLNKVNPTALILSGVLMLRYLGEKEAADRLEQAVADVIREGRCVTYDLKKERNDPTAVGTKEMGEAIIKRTRATAHA